MAMTAAAVMTATANSVVEIDAAAAVTGIIIVVVVIVVLVVAADAAPVAPIASPIVNLMKLRSVGPDACSW
jgi:hypothetical protein